MSIIILEGPEGSGKSTLAKKLSAMYGLKTFHPGRPETEEDMILVRNKILELEKSEEKYIIDRVTWISDPIYCQIFNRISPYVNLFGERDNPSNALVIFCLPSEDTTESMESGKAYKTNEYEEHVKNRSAELRALYRDTINHYATMHYQFVIYDFTDLDSFDIIRTHVEKEFGIEY